MAKISVEKAGAGIIEAAQANARALAANPYPGRGLVLGADAEGKSLVQVYWIMGRSANSRNRVFREMPGGRVRTEAFDPALVLDPSLIIYNAALRAGKAWIVTNGDQTDTIAESLASGGSFSAALEKREFEPDAPNFTSRISGIMDLSDSAYAYRLSILRRGAEGGCDRCEWRYARAQAGLGRFISTYSGDGDPLPAFSSDPVALPIIGRGPEEIAKSFWRILNTQNRVSLMARSIDPGTGEADTFIINGKEGGA